MKSTLLLLTALFTVTFYSCKKTETGETDSFVYEGDWKGSITGGDQGQISFSITTEGKVSGNGFSSQSQSSFNIT